MIRLLLLRHAKSDWGNPGLDDFDRPLNSRGRSAARAMARYLKDTGLQPDLILCSTAQRTRETLARLLPEQPNESEIRLLRALYDESGESYLPLIRRFGATVATLMVIGHNPAIEETAQQIHASGAEDLKADMELKYPSGALSVFDCPVKSWADLAPDRCRLLSFVKPRSLPGDSA